MSENAWTISQHVADAMNAETGFSQPFSAQVKAMPVFDQQSIESGLQVTVVPASVEIAPRTRSVHEYRYQVSVGFHEKLPQGDLDLESRIQQLIAVVDEVEVFFHGKRLSDGALSYVASEINPVVSQPRLRENRLFLSVLTLTFLGVN